MPERGAPIKCGDSFRLFHLSTRRNLHSHLFMSPLSNNQEVSAFGENGDGDEGDNWIVECDEKYWRRDESVRLRHEQTKKYLYVSGDQYGRPISGQMEVSCYQYANQGNLWQVNEGIYIKPSDGSSSSNDSSQGHTTELWGVCDYDYRRVLSFLSKTFSKKEKHEQFQFSIIRF